MRDILVTVVVFASIPFILKRPHIGILVWSWIGYMNPHKLAWGFATSFPFAAIVGGATIVSYALSREPKRLPLTPVTVVLALFVLWMNVTTLFALNPQGAWFQWDKVMKIQLMTFVTLMLMQSKERIQALIWVITLSIAFFGVKGGLFTLATGGQFKVLGPSGSFIAGNTEIGLALIMVLPLMRYLQLTVTRAIYRHAMTAGMILVAIAILGTQSRGAFLGGAAIAIFLFLKSRKKITLGIAMAIAIPLMIQFMPETWTSRMETIENYEQDRSAMGRIEAWTFAWNLAKARPVVGGGFEAFIPSIFEIYHPGVQPRDVHSIYFEILGEHGFVGLALFLTFGVLAWRTGSRVIRAAGKNEELKWAGDLASMIQVCLIGYCVGGAFLGLAYFDLGYHLVAIVVLLEQITRREEVMSSRTAIGQQAETRLGRVS